jgi:hypothetical protein
MHEKLVLIPTSWPTSSLACDAAYVERSQYLTSYLPSPRQQPITCIPAVYKTRTSALLPYPNKLAACYSQRACKHNFSEAA